MYGMRNAICGVAWAVVLTAASLAAFAQDERGIGGAATHVTAARKYAVVVGINRYSDPAIGTLRCAVADAAAIYEVLTGAPGGFERERSALLSDAMPSERQPMRSNVLAFLNNFISLAGPEDTVLVYFGGHGTTVDGKLYLLPSDTRLSMLTDTAISFAWLQQTLDASPAKRKVLLLDACHSAAGKALNRMTRGLEQELVKSSRGMVVLASCGPEESSYEMEDSGHGAFTYYLLEGMAGKADANADGLIGAKELSTYTWDKTRLWAVNHGFQQNPWDLSRVSGDIVLAKAYTIGPEDKRPPTVVTPETRAPKAGEVRVFEGGEFVYIPEGSFEMGDKLSASRIASTYGGEEKWYQDAPRHRVTISKGFWLGRYEVTNAEFAAFVKATGHTTDAEKEGWGYGRKVDGKSWSWDKVSGITWRNPGWKTAPKEPVVLVSWNDANAYISWLNKNSRETYRLPTEAEWEYACRAGTSTEFFWGDDARGGEGYLNGTDETPSPEGGGWKWNFPFKDGYFFPAPVGSFKPNPWGLYDMHGNVNEWCSDWYGDYPSGAVTDPEGPASGEYRVCRGGSWNSGPGRCRSASRRVGTPVTCDGTVGFRLVAVARGAN